RAIFTGWQNVPTRTAQGKGLLCSKSSSHGWYGTGALPKTLAEVLESANARNMDDGMSQHHPTSKIARVASVAILLVMLSVAVQVGFIHAQSNTAAPSTDSELIAQFRRVEVASVSD